MKLTSKILGLAALALAFAPSIHAQSIGINFGSGATGDSSIPANVSAGYVPQTNFNNISGAGGTALALINSTGAASGALLTYTAGEQYNVNGTASAGNGNLLKGFISTNNGTPNATISVTNITFSLYDVYVYINHDRDFEDVGIALNSGTRNVYVENNPDVTANPVPFVLATPFTGPQNAPTTGTRGDYILFSGVSGTTLSIAYDNAGAYGNSDRGGISGLQIVAAVPEPSTWVMALGGIAMLIGFGRIRHSLS